MIFSSYIFIFGFFPVVFIVYRLLSIFKQKTASKVWLVCASFFFYGQGSPKFFWIFAFTVFFNYAAGSLIGRAKTKTERKIFFAVGLIENIALLGYFKYTNFLVENINALTGANIVIKTIILPIGISFFTFQLIAFLVDSYRGETKQYNILSYLLFITFFPQLIVGPIVHHSDVVPQFEDKDQPKFNKKNLMLALFLFAFGCSKKILLADPLTNFSEPYFMNVPDIGVIKAWISTFAFTISYYFDMSGYADMAIGLGLLFNIKLPRNFNSPYRSRDFAEYWNRWHITLSKFLSDYIFRSVKKKGGSAANFYFAVMVTFFVSGAWHGAGWTFIVWGLVNGIFVCISHVCRRAKIIFPYLLGWFLTFLGVMATRVLFVSNSFSTAAKVYKNMFNFSEFSGIIDFVEKTTHYLAGNAYQMTLLLVATVIVFGMKNTGELTDHFKPKLRYALIAGTLFAISLFQMNSVAKFLYFQF